MKPPRISSPFWLHEGSYVFDSTGSKVAWVCGDGPQPCWSPNGKAIAALPRVLSALEYAHRCALAACHDANPDGTLAPGDSAELDAATMELETYQHALEAAGYTFNTPTP